MFFKKNLIISNKTKSFKSKHYPRMKSRYHNKRYYQDTPSFFDFFKKQWDIYQNELFLESSSSSSETNSTQQRSRLYKEEEKNKLIWVGGGPGSGKTTLLYNLINELYDKTYTPYDKSLIFGKTLEVNLNHQQVKKFISGVPVMIDNHGSEINAMKEIIRQVSGYNYQCIFINPWIDRFTFEKRLIQRKNEVGRDYDLEAFWNIHLTCNQVMHDCIMNNNLFDVIIAYDNRDDITKPLLYVKVGDAKFHFNQDWLKQLVSQSPRLNKNDFPSQNTYFFNPKPQLLTPQIKEILEIALKKPQQELYNYLKKINTHCYEYEPAISTNLMSKIMKIYRGPK